MFACMDSLTWLQMLYTLIHLLPVCENVSQSDSQTISCDHLQIC